MGEKKNERVEEVLRAKCAGNGVHLPRSCAALAIKGWIFVLQMRDAEALLSLLLNLHYASVMCNICQWAIWSHHECISPTENTVALW